MNWLDWDLNPHSLNSKRNTQPSSQSSKCKFSCPDYKSSFIGKTERTLFERTKQHVTRADSAIKGHVDNCVNMKHLFSTNNLILNDVNHCQPTFF